MKIVVNKCPYTGKIFEDNKKYAAHLQQLRRARQRDNEEARIKSGFAIWLADEKEKITDPDMLALWILENQKKLMSAVNAFKIHSWSSDRFYPETDIFTEFKINVTWRNNTSNSHACPRNGVMNWGGRAPGAPTGYPGWHGRVSGTLLRDKKHMSSYPYSSICKFLNLHTGSGGGGNESWGYDLTIFDADWPSLSQTRMFNIIANKND